jgi:hypothetical protein
MVVINKGQANELYFNLTSKKRLASSPYIFIKFTNDMTKQSYFINPDETVEPRHSLIEFTEGSDISLGAEGFYTYVIYQVEQDTLENDDDLTDARIIERGKALVKDASVTEVSYTQYTPTSNKNTTNSNTQYISI